MSPLLHGYIDLMQREFVIYTPDAPISPTLFITIISQHCQLTRTDDTQLSDRSVIYIYIIWYWPSLWSLLQKILCYHRVPMIDGYPCKLLLYRRNERNSEQEGVFFYHFQKKARNARATFLLL